MKNNAYIILLLNIVTIYCDMKGRCGLIREADLPQFDATRCGNICHQSPFTMDTFYCEKGETCCPDGAHSEKCSKKCGPYNAEETFGDCHSEDCCWQDVSCNVKCHPDNKCRYTDYVLRHNSNVCEQPKKIGPCRAWIPRFYFNSTYGKCKEFGWGGCDPNENNFKTNEDCEKMCIASNTTTTTKTTASTTKDYTTTEDSTAKSGRISITTSIGYCIEVGYLLLAMTTAALVAVMERWERI